jgi:hypothetical protein
MLIWSASAKKKHPGFAANGTSTLPLSFAATHYHGQLNVTASDTDVLKSVTVYRQFEYCL